MRKIIGIFVIFTLLLGSYSSALALDKAGTIEAYTADLVALGLEEGAANDKAISDVNAVISSMMAAKSDSERNFEAISERVDAMTKTDTRRDDALNALDGLMDKNLFTDDAGILKDFLEMVPDQNLYFQESIGGAPPRVTAVDDFRLAEESVERALSRINRILIAPTRPGNVPTGDIVSDFIPQIIRQLFRFAWLGVLVAFTVSGVLLIIAHGNDEKVTKAKSMIYFSLVGFAFIALAFAIIKGVTDIDFFRFI